jgi:dipeptidase D
MKKSLIIIIFIVIIAAAFGLVLYYTGSMGGTTYKKNLVGAANSYGKQVKTLFQNDGLICSNDGTNFKSVVTIPAEGFDEVSNLVQEYEELFNEEYKSVENKISFTLKEVDLPQGLIPEEIQDDLVNAITACPNGVLRFIPEMPNTVETSNNLSIVKSDGENVFVASLIRSSMESKKEELASMVESLFLLAGAKVEFSGNYPGWTPDMKSEIMAIMSDVYTQKFGRKPEIKVIHAGLECGIIGAKKGDLDMISFGPTILHPHSPDEKVNILSVQRFWEFLTTTLENVK